MSRRNVFGSAFCFLTAVVVLGPMLAWGYPLRYDQVSVPSQQFNPDTWGVGDGLPRAVPLDAVTATLSAVLPDAWLTQLLALVALTAAGFGVFRLVPGPLAARLVGGFAATVNPFVLEQLAIGHLPHLMAYGMLPWIALLCWEPGRPTPLRLAGLTVAVALCSLTPGGGALGLLLVATCLVFRRPRPFPWSMLVVSAALQLPWVVTGLVSPNAGGPDAGGPSDPALSVAAFSLRSETGWGSVVDALGLSGMWNQAALPADRTVALVRLTCVLFILLSLAGAATLAPRLPRRVLLAAGFFVGSTFLVAVLPAIPGARTLFVQAITDVPSLGLFRDGHRWLAPLALLEAVLIGMSTTALARLRGPATAIVVGCLVAACLINIFWGLNGRLRAWSYPPDFVRAAQIVNASPGRGAVLVLPWASFRDYTWLEGNTALDPMPRMLRKKTIVSRVLIVSGRPLQQEGTLATAMDGYNADGRLTQEELNSLSAGWVLTERQTSGRPTAVPTDWPVVFEGPTVVLQRNPRAVTAEPRPAAARIASYAAFSIYGLLLLGAALVIAARGRPSRPTNPQSGTSKSPAPPGPRPYARRRPGA